VTRRRILLWLVASAFALPAATGAKAGGFRTAAGAHPASGAPVRVVVVDRSRQGSSGFGARDAITASVGLFGALLGFGGAIAGARLAARSEEKRAEETRREAAARRVRERKLLSLGAVTEYSANLMEAVIKAAQGDDHDWASQNGEALRVAIRLGGLRASAASRLARDSGVRSALESLVASTNALAQASTVDAARKKAVDAGHAYDRTLSAVQGAEDAVVQEEGR
jgi:hypothetical protein